MSKEWLRNRMKENWHKIKHRACELLYNEALESWKQAICYVGYIEFGIHPDELEYILQAERSTIFRNAKKAEAIIESNRASMLNAKITIAASPGAADVKNTKEDPPGAADVKTTTEDVGCSNNAKNTMGDIASGAIEENTIDQDRIAATEQNTMEDLEQ